MAHLEFLADRTEGGRTIAELLRIRFKMTWTQAKRIVERGHVRVAGFACTDPAHRVRAKNRIWVREGVITFAKKLPPPAPAGKAPAKPKVHTEKPNAGRPKSQKRDETIPKTPKTAKEVPPVKKQDFVLSDENLVYVDDFVVVVNKPAGLTTMRHDDETKEFGERAKKFLPKTLADYLPRLLGAPNIPVIAVHRIDRDTSGLVVFARSPAVASNLTGQFRKHTAERKYLALVRGEPKAGTIRSTLFRDRGDGRRGSLAETAAKARNDGKDATTHVHVLERWNGFGLVECRLETGRTHQVRIHLGEAGFPLCGERVYDRPLGGKPIPDGSKAQRPMLHAVLLGFTHPESGEKLRWEVAPPEDFQKLNRKLRTGES